MKFLILILFINFAAHAQSNPFLIPIGNSEGITANTGIGRDGSVGSVLYNPAGLAAVTSPKISASGSAFSSNTISIKVEGSDETDNKYFETNPSQITTIFKNEKFNWAFSILVPYSAQSELKIKGSDATLGNYVTDQEDRVQEMLIGPSIGYKLSDQFKIGLSVFGSKVDARETQDSFVNSAQQFMSSFKIKKSSISAFPVLGALYTPTNSFSLGLRFSGPSTQFSGTQESKYNSILVAGPDVTSDEKKSDLKYRKPIDVGVGISYKVSPEFKLLVDISNQFQTKYEEYSEDAFGDSSKISLKNVLRYNLGFEYDSTKKDKITAGLMYNPGAEEDESEVLNYKGLTLGYHSIEEKTDSSFGLFYMEAKNDTDGILLKHKVMGLFVSSSINFLN